MKIFPAIDIIDGKVVRLTKGDYEQAKNYAVTPLEAAKSFADLGAKYLHVVDLDGAKSGRAENATTIKHILSECEMFIEVGGGIRSLEQIENYLQCGVKRVILGTIAVKDTKFLQNALRLFGSSVAVGVDALDGKVAINGWKEVTDIDSLSFCRRLNDMGVNNVIYTDIGRDGMLKGANLQVYDVLCQTEYPKITASGGITSIDELKYLDKIGAYGAILGKALYENAIELSAAIAAVKE